MHPGRKSIVCGSFTDHPVQQSSERARLGGKQHVITRGRIDAHNGVASQVELLQIPIDIGCHWSGIVHGSHWLRRSRVTHAVRQDERALEAAKGSRDVAFGEAIPAREQE